MEVIKQNIFFVLTVSLLVVLVCFQISYGVFHYLNSEQTKDEPVINQVSNETFSIADHIYQKDFAKKSRLKELWNALNASTFQVINVSFVDNALIIDNMINYNLDHIECSMTLTTPSGKEVKRSSIMQAASDSTSYCNGFTIPFQDINEYGNMKIQIGVSYRSVLKIAESAYNIPKPKTPKTVIFIGDSITRGYLATSSNAVQVAAGIMSGDPDYIYTVRNMGINGILATNYGVNIGLAAKADYAMISLGVNDALRKESSAVYASGMRSIINTLQMNGVGKIILNKPVCTGGGATSGYLEGYGRALYGLVGGNVVLGDFTACEMTRSDGSLINADGIHLTNAGYRRLGERWASAFFANK